MRSKFGLLPMCALAVALGSWPARADKIDGEWCAADGRRLAIAGPAITTPGGARSRQLFAPSFQLRGPEGRGRRGADGRDVAQK